MQYVWLLVAAFICTNTNQLLHSKQQILFFLESFHAEVKNNHKMDIIVRCTSVKLDPEIDSLSEADISRSDSPGDGYIQSKK